MISETIAKIENMLSSSIELDEAKRAELLKLIASLKAELGNFPEAHADQVRSFISFAEISAHEATRKQSNPRLLKLSLDGLKHSVNEFEATHPELVRSVNAFINALSGMGI